MKYPLPKYSDSIDPVLTEWMGTLPLHVQEMPNTMSCIMRFGHRIYDNEIKRDSYTNPFYKLNELLRSPQLEYHHLQTLKEYYKVDLITYLTTGNRAIHYLGYSCQSASDLKSALCPGKNQTGEYTLANILGSII